MTKQSVSIVRYRENHETIKNALELCNGLKGLKAIDKVLIKPNIVLASRRKKIPLYGVVTTTRVIEDIIILLREYGCKDITIGEGSPFHKELELSTINGFKSTGLVRVAEKYGVKLVDFNKSEFRSVDLGQTKVKLARESLENDFLINVPVLKTHRQTTVSLNLKNLKGCLKQSSKMKFHKTGLDEICKLFVRTLLLFSAKIFNFLKHQRLIIFFNNKGIPGPKILRIFRNSKSTYSNGVILRL